MEEIKSFEDFKKLKKKNVNEAKKYLVNYWKTDKLIGHVDAVRKAQSGNRYALIKNPTNLENISVDNPFNHDKRLEDCYVSLNKIKYNEVENQWIIFDFDMNIDSKFDEKNLIRGTFYDTVMRFNQMLKEFNIKLKDNDNRFEGYFVEYDNTPLKIYDFFKNLNKSFLDDISLKSKEKEQLENEISKRKEIARKELEKEMLKRKEIIKKEEEEARREEIEKIDNDIKEKEEKIKKLKNKEEKYKKLGILIEEEQNKSVDNKGRLDITDEKLRVHYIQKYLKLKKGLTYSINLIRRFYTAIKTHDIIILSGAPGVGKTSLVRYFAEAIGGEAKIIPVQTNWMDNQDLLGFYNPVEKNYFSTPFLDAMVEARQNEGKLYFICLDEMNLARVEYYFAEILSSTEGNSSEKKIINLYGKFIYDELKKKVDEISQSEKFNDEEKHISDQFKILMKRYPPEFIIPENVRFIGTINADETTMELSPKVIDRSFIIEISGDDSNKIEKNKFKNEDVTENIYIGPKEFQINNADVENVRKFNAVNGNISDIESEFKKIGVKLTKRFEKQFRRLYLSYDWKKSEDGINDFFDFIISSKILPKVSFVYDDKTDSERINNIGKKISNYTISSSKFENMCKNASENKIITYWI